MTALRTLSVQADSDLLDALEAIAARQGRAFDAVVADAIKAYVDRRPEQAAEPDARRAFWESLAERDELYRSLAR